MPKKRFLAALAAFALIPAVAVAALPSPETEQLGSCTDGGGHLWQVRTVWGAVADGRIANDTAEFTTAAADATTVDWSMRIYNSDGTQQQVTGGQDTAFDFGGGGRYLTRNLQDPTAGAARLVVSVGDGNDGAGNCSVSFAQPAGDTPAPTATASPVETATPSPTAVPSTASPTPSATPTPTPTPTVTASPTPPADTTQAATRLGWGTPYTGDEFGYIGSPDSTRWSLYNSAGHAGNGLRRPAQWQVNGEYARVTGLPNGTTGGMSFKPDRGSTSGRWEVRMRTTRQPAYHAVLIVWPDAGRSAVPGCQEIDFAEATKTLNVNRFYLHHTCPNETTTASRTLDMTQWHNYAVEWTPTRITGYVDGVKFYEDTRYAPKLRAPSHLTAQLDWFPGDGATTTNSTMDLDWVRVYRLNSSGPTVTPTTPAPSATTAAPTATATAPTGNSCEVAATADIAGSADKANAVKTAAIVKARPPQALLIPGDIAYEAGTTSDFANYYNPAYGSLKPITRPVPGNHEYKTAGAAGYRTYFNTTAANYAYDVCGWRAVAVNQYAGISAGASFIASQRAAHPGKPMLVYWHEPRWSSGMHGNETAVQPLWDAAVKAGAKLVVNGHDHNYERFAPQSTTGTGSASGPREFVSGLGGKGPRAMGTTRANSEKRITANTNLGNLGVLYLDLQPTSYSWAFRQVNGAVGDSGTTRF